LIHKKSKIQPARYLPNQKQLFVILAQICLRNIEKQRKESSHALENQNQIRPLVGGINIPKLPLK